MLSPRNVHCVEEEECCAMDKARLEMSRVRDARRGGEKMLEHAGCANIKTAPLSRHAPRPSLFIEKCFISLREPFC
jgi:hypothetical protein